MVRNKDADGIKSSLIINEVKNRPCLFDSNDPSYGDRAEKSRCWEEVCDSVVPRWSALTPTEKFTAGKEVQKRWRSIRDSYTKMYRQGKCVPAEQCTPGSRRYHYHRDLAFLRQALHNKKPRISQDKYESYSEVSNSPQHPPPEDMPRIKAEIMDKPLDLKTKPDPERLSKELKQTEPLREERPELRMKMVDKCNQTVETVTPVEIKIDANSMSILPEDHFDDDRLFMNSLIPFFKKMNDDTRLLCRIEVLKIIRYALQGSTCFEALRTAEDSFFKDRMSGILKQEIVDRSLKNDSISSNSTLSMTTRSADGSRPIRKRRTRSPSPLPAPVKKRGPGRPRKIRPPPSDSEEEQNVRKRTPKLKACPPHSCPPAPCPQEPCPPEVEDAYSKLTSVAQLSPRMFMKMYNLSRSIPPVTIQPPQIKTEPTESEQPI